MGRDSRHHHHRPVPEDGRRDPLVRAVTWALCGPGLVAAVIAVRRGWVPTSDSGTIATRSYDVLTERSPLVGQYSLATGDDTVATHSLGPLLYWLLALPVRVGPLVAPAVAMALANTVALVGAARVAFRGGRGLGLAVTVSLLVLVRSLGLGELTSIWNPTAALLPFVALIWVGWAVMAGRSQLLPLLAALASFVAQCHLTYLLPALVVSIGGVASVGHDLVRGRASSEREDRPRRRLLTVTALVLVLCWVAPVAEQVGGERGNLTRIVQSSDGGDRIGLGRGLDVAARTLAGPPPWLRRRGTASLHPDEITTPVAPLARAVAALVVGALLTVTVIAHRRRDRRAFALGAVACGLLVAATAVTALLPREQLIVAGYSLRWTAAAGMVAWIAVGWGASRALATRLRRGPRRTVLVGVAVVLLLVVAATPTRDRSDWTYRPAARFGAAAVEATEPGGRYQVEAGELGGVLPAAVGFQLRAAGREPVLPASVGLATGQGYSRRGERCDAVLVMVPYGEADGRDELLASAVINPPDRPARRWDLVIGPDDGDASC